MLTRRETIFRHAGSSLGAAFALLDYWPLRRMMLRFDRMPSSPATPLLLAVAVSLSAAIAVADEAAERTLPLIEGTTIRFATKEEAAAFLGREDEYTQSLSPIDRQIRTKSGEDPGDEAFRAHAASAARDWSPEEKEAIAAAWALVREPLAGLRAKLPQEILLIRTSGEEESNAAYTRGNAIVLPEPALRRDRPQLARLLAHELFHVLSRHEPAVRWDLYRIIGFEPCKLTGAPESLTSRKITNPDAPLWNCRIAVGKPGEEIHGVPVLLARLQNGAPRTNGSLFEVMEFKLLLVERTRSEEGASDAWQPMTTEGRPLLVDPRSVPTFSEKIGGNTRYVIHPDEILAENFVHAIFDTPDLPDPQIVDELDQILFRP